MGQQEAIQKRRPQTLGFVAEAQERLGALPVQQTMREAWLSHADIREGHRILEVGCGTGVVTRDLAARVGPFGKVTAIEPSESLLRVAARIADDAGLATRIQFRLGDVLALDLPPNAYDGVVASMLFQHIADQRTALQQLRRVLRPGARFVAFEQDMESLSVDHPDRALTRIILQNGAERHVLSPDAAKRLPGLCTELGFVDVEVLTFLQAERTEGYLLELLGRLAQLAVVHGRARPENARAWMDTLAEKAQDGTFFASFPHYAILAQKPPFGAQRERDPEADPDDR